MLAKLTVAGQQARSIATENIQRIKPSGKIQFVSDSGEIYAEVSYCYLHGQYTLQQTGHMTVSGDMNQEDKITLELRTVAKPRQSV